MKWPDWSWKEWLLIYALILSIKVFIWDQWGFWIGIAQYGPFK